MDLTEEQLFVIATGLRDEKPTAGWDGVYGYVKKSQLFKDWKIPDSKIKYIAEVIKIYDYNIPKSYDSLLGSDGFKGFENYAPNFEDEIVETPDKKNPNETKKPKKVSKKSSTSSGASSEVIQAMKVIDYKVVRDKNLSGLEAKVKAEMRKGWVPYGGAGTASFGISVTGGNSFIQAVVKLK